MTNSENLKDNNELNSSVKYNKSYRIKYTQGKIAIKLDIAQQVLFHLNNNHGVQVAMQPLGYQQQKIAAFNQVYQKALTANSEIAVKYGDKVGAYEDFTKAFAQVKKDFQILLKIAKIALRDYPQKMDNLQLKTKKGRSIADIFTYLEHFYSLTLKDDEILALLAQYSYSFERISGFYSAFLDTREAYQKYCLADAASIEATRVRDLCIKELDQWMYEYFSLSKIADAMD